MLSNIQVMQKRFFTYFACSLTYFVQNRLLLYPNGITVDAWMHLILSGNTFSRGERRSVGEEFKWGVFTIK